MSGIAEELRDVVLGYLSQRKGGLITHEQLIDTCERASKEIEHLIEVRQVHREVGDEAEEEVLQLQSKLTQGSKPADAALVSKVKLEALLNAIDRVCSEWPGMDMSKRLAKAADAVREDLKNDR